MLELIICILIIVALVKYIKKWESAGDIIYTK